MWKILKAEIGYNRLGLGIAFTIILLIFFSTLYFSVEGVYTFMPNSAIAFAIAVAAMGSESDKEKRDRLYVLLPQTIKQHSIVRLLFMIVFQLTVFCLWLAVYFLINFFGDPSAIWTMISFNAFVIIMITLFAIYGDLGHFYTQKYRGIFFLTLITVLLLAYIQEPDFNLVRLIEIRHATYMVSLYKNLLSSPIGASLSSMLFLGVLSLSCLIFTRRKSYLA
jgi:hypothetical protein